MTDELISRQAAIETVKDAIIEAEWEYAENAIKQLPPAPERTGHWIGCDGSYICSECNSSPIDFIGTMGISFDAYIETSMNYCPNCGAHMIEEMDG